MNKSTLDALKAAAYTGLWAFLGIFAAALLGWLGDVQQWATGDGGSTVFPDPAVLVKAAVAGVAAGFSFLAAALVRLAQVAGILPGNPPSYPDNPNDENGSTVFRALWALCAVTAAVVIFVTHQ